MLSIPVIFGGTRPSEFCIYIPSEEVEFPVEQVKRIQKCIEDGRRARERAELIRQFYPRIQRECPEFISILQDNIQIREFDDEQLTNRILDLNKLPSFIRDEISHHAHGSEDVQRLEREVCMYACHRVRASVSQLADATIRNSDECFNFELEQPHLCKFQVKDLEHCFAENAFSPKDTAKLAYDITALTVPDIERIIKERSSSKQSSAGEVSVHESLSLIRSLCMDSVALLSNFQDCDEPVLLIGNTGCGNLLLLQLLQCLFLTNDVSFRQIYCC